MLTRTLGIVLLATLESGCATAQVVLPTGMPAEQVQAAEDLGLPVEWRPLDGDGYGQIVVTLVDSLPGSDLGRASRKHPCRPTIAMLSQRHHPTVLAHEIGHALLLMHSPEAPHGLMAPTVSQAAEVTEEQRAVMQAGVYALKLCRSLRARREREEQQP